MEMAQLALQADLPSEAKQVVDKGFASGVARHRRRRPSGTSACATSSPSGSPRATAARAPRRRSRPLAAKTGDPLVAVGMNQVYSGQAAKGVQLMQQGIAKGGLKRPEDAKLHLGIAQLVAGDKAKAQATFKTVQGADGTADLARLWMLHARRSALEADSEPEGLGPSLSEGGERSGEGAALSTPRRGRLRRATAAPGGSRRRGGSPRR